MLNASNSLSTHYSIRIQYSNTQHSMQFFCVQCNVFICKKNLTCMCVETIIWVLSNSNSAQCIQNIDHYKTRLVFQTVDLRIPNSLEIQISGIVGNSRKIPNEISSDLIGRWRVWFKKSGIRGGNEHSAKIHVKIDQNTEIWSQRSQVLGFNHYFNSGDRLRENSISGRASH